MTILLETTRLKLLQQIKNLGAQLLVTHPRGFRQKYQSRELFHKRSKDQLYRRMRRNNQTLEANCHEKDLLLKSQNREIELLQWQILQLQVLLRDWKEWSELSTSRLVKPNI